MEELYHAHPRKLGLSLVEEIKLHVILGKKTFFVVSLLVKDITSMSYIIVFMLITKSILTRWNVIWIFPM